MGEVFWHNCDTKSQTFLPALLALATLGDVTQIGLFLYMLCCQMWPRQVEMAKMSMILFRNYAKKLQ
jgi:hypothetical protein